MNVDIHLLSGAYALDALDPHERAEFEAHLSACASCQAEVASFHEVGASLSSLAATPPPADLRDRVLSSIKTVRPLPPETSAPAPTPPTTGTVIPLRRRRWFTTSLIVAAAAVLVIGLAWHPWSDKAAADPIQAVMAAPDAQQIKQPLTGGGTVTIYRSVSLNQSAAVADDLPTLPNDEVYQIWYQDPAGAMIPAALMPSGSDAEVLLQGSATDSTAAGITVEPEGGSSAPTTEPVALFPFSES